MILDKIPPNNIDLEESVLASVLIGSEGIDDVFLTPDEFYKPAHTIIFQAMRSLQNKNIEIDMLSVINKLKEINKLEVVGGATYISRLIDCPSTVNLDHYVKKIKESSNLRKLIAISSGVTSSCFDKEKSATDIIEDAQRDISEIGAEETGSTDIKDILNSTFDKLEKLRESDGFISGIPSGFPKLDKHTSGFQNSDLILIGARPSMGKTTFAVNIAKYAAFNFYPVLIFSLEMSNEQLTHRMLSEMAEVDGMKFKSSMFSDSEWNRVRKATERLYEMPIHIVDKSGLSINEIMSITRSFKRKYGISLVVLDYIQLINGWNKDGQGPKAKISNGLKAIAKSLNLPVIALTQLNRNLERREDKRPIMSDLRESGALEQDADIAMFLYRQEVYETKEEKASGINRGNAELLIRKNRQGSIGMTKLKFVPEFTRFFNVNDDY